MAMFERLPQSGGRQRGIGMAASVVVHAAFLGVLLYHGTAAFVSFSETDLGIPNSYGSRSITYIAPVGPERTPPAAEEQPKLALRRVAPKPAPKPKAAEHHELASKTADDALEATARGGSPFGRVPGSPMTFDEVVPAFPVVYPDPAVSRGDLPAGVQGDVIVQVTIDPQGNVVETKLIQGIGYGIEQKVLDVLQRWRFHPAVRDGVNIASQHIVHFHYPS
jgi:TonB family protein